MTTIYIVKNDVGDYEDHRETSLCAVSSEEKAAELVTQLVEFNKFKCDFTSRMQDEFRNGWEKLHPVPRAPEKPKVPEGYHELQWVLSELSKKPVTSKFLELKEDFKKLQNIHDENLKLYKVELGVYHEQLKTYAHDKYEAETNLHKKNYVVPSHLIEVAKIVDEADHSSNLDNEYSYYELTLLQ